MFAQQPSTYVWVKILEDEAGNFNSDNDYL